MLAPHQPRPRRPPRWRPRASGNVVGRSPRGARDLPAGFSEYLTAAAAPLRDSTAERFVAAVERGQHSRSTRRSRSCSSRIRPSRRAGGSPRRTASCRRRARARARRARPGSTPRARACTSPPKLSSCQRRQPHAGADVAVVGPRRHLAEEQLVDELPALGSSCMTPIAPALETTSCWKPGLHPGDARASFGSTP